jgi:hypothetical protein
MFSLHKIARELFTAVANLGLGDQDFSVVALEIKRLNGLLKQMPLIGANVR